MCQLSWNWEPKPPGTPGSLQACNGIALPLPLKKYILQRHEKFYYANWRPQIWGKYFCNIAYYWWYNIWMNCLNFFFISFVVFKSYSTILTHTHTHTHKAFTKQMVHEVSAYTSPKGCLTCKRCNVLCMHKTNAYKDHVFLSVWKLTCFSCEPETVTPSLSF
jgi:hypothetical protein